jgi:hypothetical protein
MKNRVSPPSPPRDRYVCRVMRALGWRRLAVVVLMTFLWSTPTPVSST